ncbi:MAG: DUF2130 domain-containing protein [Ruminococcaceae bacterium]|nr:DUF2130 domain-containing protein [Oscillospiraceae bacterium]
MAEIKCPNCGKMFQVEQSEYAQIVRQIHDSEFEAEIRRREEELKKSQESDFEIARLRQEQKQEAFLAEQEKKLAQRDREISELKARLSTADSEKKLAVMEAVEQKEKELAEKEKLISTLSGDLKVKEAESELSIKALTERYEGKLKDKDEQIEYYKDFKLRQSTKMIGESLEQHCMNQFNQIRTTAFPGAYFEKDNDAGTGSKGDFIFRDYVDGVEYISIMFEMKNEADETKTKKKNEDFFKELDKDRKEKRCEYAVLVSMLESDNEYYNNGIVDVSYRYEKMYVIRPQFFIPLISLLKNAAMNSLQYQKELQIVRSQQLDLVNFEENLNAFKQGFAKNFKDAGERFRDAVDGIDKAIEQLTKIKNALTKSEKHLLAANNKIEEVTIRKLTKNAPSVKAMFDELQKD